MKRFVVLLIVGALAGTGMVSGANAGINEPFNYPDGNLTTVSAGAWQKWDPASSGDAVVAGGIAVINPPTDVARLFPAELTTVGNVVTFSFDVNVTTGGGAAGDYSAFFSPATLPLSTGQDYPNSLGFTFDWGAAAAGTTNFGIWPGGGNPTNVAVMTSGAFHTISGTLTKNATTISYAVQVDGGPVFNGSSAHTSALGLNCFEMYNQLGTGVAGGFRLDNLVMTPEPGTLTLLAIAGFAAIRRRRS